ncbi:MAG: hypothetical protein WCG75_00780 [Armatimonadota bacterium]
MSQVTRVVIHEDPFHFGPEVQQGSRGRLDAKFIAHPNGKTRPFFCVYYLDIPEGQSLRARIHVTADERYAFFVDGNLKARGSERGDQEHWFYETYDLDLSGGERIAFVTWALGTDHAPFAQVSVQHGFLCVADDPTLKEKLTTGHALWKCIELKGIETVRPTSTYGVGDRFRLHGNELALWKIWARNERGGKLDVDGSAVPIQVETPTLPEAVDLRPIRILRPALLPAMYYKDWTTFKVRQVENCAAYDTASVTIEAKNDLKGEHGDWDRLFSGGMITIGPNRKVRVIVDLDNYVCAYWHLSTTSGSSSKVRIHFQEALIKDFKDGNRGNRDEVEGGHFVMMWSRALGFGDEILPSGRAGESYTVPWWCSGRYMEIYVETDKDSVSLHNFRLEETHYPIHPQTPPFHCSDEQLNKIVDICIRTLQMDAHETFFDCPFFEQLQYVGDSRIESMVMMAITDDNRLPAKATDLYRWSIGYRGMTQSRYPSQIRQYIPPFSIWWILMVHDQHVWRGDKALLKQMLPAVRTVLSFFEQFVDRDKHSAGFGLLKSPDQWNFVDWVSAWPNGVPPEGEGGHSIVINMQLLLALEAAIELETVYGYNQSHRPTLVWAQDLRIAIKKHMNSEGLLMDSPGAKTVSEQQHALALLTNDRELQKTGEIWYSKNRDAAKATYYFQHYRHEAYGKLGRADLILANIRDQWGGMIKLGLRTTIEMPEPGRSDCHAWSAHPLLHLQTKILGIAPLAPFQYEFKPNLGDLDWAEGYVSTGKGPIHARIERKGTSFKTELIVPDGVTVSVPSVRGLIVGPRSVTINI